VQAGRDAFARVIAPLMPDRHLCVLLGALERDDPRLCQRVTTWPAWLTPGAAARCESACAMAFGGWQSDGLVTVGEVVQLWVDLASRVDRQDPWALGAFTGWFDDWPRAEVFAAMIAMVREELDRRGVSWASH